MCEPDKKRRILTDIQLWTYEIEAIYAISCVINVVTKEMVDWNQVWSEMGLCTMHNTIRIITLVKQSPSIPQFYGYHCIVYPALTVISNELHAWFI